MKKIAATAALVIAAATLISYTPTYNYPSVTNVPESAVTAAEEASVCESVNPLIYKKNSGEGSDTVSVTVSATGDCTLGNNVNMSYSGSFDSYYDSFGASYFFQNAAGILSEDDFTIANLEGPLTTSDDKQVKVCNHRGRQEYAEILTSGSVEAVSLSNNHTLDFGETGYNDTISALNGAGVAWACDGTYGIYETKGIKIGFVSVDEHYDGKLIEVWLEEGISQLRALGADIVIACIHWGRTEDEKTSHVDDYQVELGYKCIDWGYDLVIGNHVHVLEGINKYKGKYIIYSLGNFSYGGNKNPTDKDCGIFQQTFTFTGGELKTDDNVKFIPCSISSVSYANNYKPTPASGSEALRITSKMNAYSAKYGVVFRHDGNIAKQTINEQNKSDAYYSIFLKSLNTEPLGSSVRYVGVDLSSLGLADSSYLSALLKEWARSTGVNLFIGSKKEIIDLGYRSYAVNGTGRIFIFGTPEWSNLQVNCGISRIITLHNYLDSEYAAVFVNGLWETQEGSYIQK